MPLDRLHCATFVNAVGGMLLAATAFAADGASDRAFKVLLTVAVSLMSGAGAVPRDRARLDLSRPARRARGARALSLLLGLLFVLVAVSGTGVALSRTPRRQVFAMAVNGMVLALLFMALQAPDVAFAEVAVGTAALPLLFLVVLASIKMDRSPPGGDGQ